MRTAQRHTPKLERTTFETSRAAEYFYDHELEKLTGQSQHNFATVALKELVDNALDACETAGVAPEVGVDVVAGTADDLTLTVTDNGGGIEPDTIGRILNFDTRASDKALYRTPTRGQQGNALKTVVAMPFAMGDPDPLVVIQARGVEHRICATLGAGDVPDIRHKKFPVAGTAAGTTVRVRLPGRTHPNRARNMMRAYHLFNPHAKVSFRSSRLGVDHVNQTRQQLQKLTFPAM
jgi:DNA topoisomerase VI subunit B